MAINLSVQYNGGLLHVHYNTVDPMHIYGTTIGEAVQIQCRGFVSTAYETVYYYYHVDDVLHCFCFVFYFCLVSLHDD